MCFVPVCPAGVLCGCVRVESNVACAVWSVYGTCTGVFGVV